MNTTGFSESFILGLIASVGGLISLIFGAMRKKLSKNYMLTHLKSRHSNCFGTPYWDKYSDRYKKIVEDNKKMFVNNKDD